MSEIYIKTYRILILKRLKLETIIEIIELEKKTKILNIIAIKTALFNLLAKKYSNQIFTISYKDIDNQLNKDQKPQTDSRAIISQKYYKQLDVFLKKVFDKLALYRLYNYKIELKDNPQKKLRNPLLYLISAEELFALKKYLQKNLNKEFIVLSSILIILSVLFVYKLREKLRFYINYRRLNEIIRKDQYSILLIEETLSQL